MAAKTLTPSAPLVQGISSPNVKVDPNAFYAATRRLRYPMQSITTIQGLGSTDATQLRQSGIVAGLEVRVSGTVTFGGTITGTSMSYNWPQNLINTAQLSANGQSNLVSASGLQIRALEFIANPKLDDTGLAASFGATAVTAGSLKLPCDDWGTSAGNSLNPGATVPATGTYTVDLTFFIPVAADYRSLVGSVYAASAATNLSLGLQWETQANLLTLGGSATFAQALQYSVTGLVYSIPNVGGQYVVPDLSHFHQLSKFQVAGLGQGTNQINLPGVGTGRRLMRALFQVTTGTPPVPLAMNATNFNTLDWAYGGNLTPEAYADGMSLRALNIRQAGVDLGARWGFGLWDFASEFALRDTIDESETANLRLDVGLVASPTAGICQAMQETLFAAPVGA